MADALIQELADAHRWVASTASEVAEAIAALNAPWKAGDEYGRNRRAALGAVAAAISHADTANELLKAVHKGLVPDPLPTALTNPKAGKRVVK